MMTSFFRENKNISCFLLLALTVTLVFNACNKTASNTLDSPENAANPQAKVRKVLMIVMDGGKGSEVKQIAPPVMTDLSENSIFSWDAINTTENITTVSNEAGVATMLTGVNPAKHGVITNVTDNNFDQYATIFSKLKELSPNSRTVAISSSADVVNIMAADATEKKMVSSDAAAKDAALSELNSGNPSFLYVQFTAADQAGMTDAYLATSATYRNAVLQIDQYIGEILTALKARTNAPNEDWIVVIASPKGNSTPYNPVAKPWSAFDDGRHNSFLIMANPRFAYNNKQKPSVFPYYGTTNSYRIGNVTGTSRRYAEVKNAAKYNFGTTGDFSVQCKVKIPSGNFNYPSFLGKRRAFATGAGDHGWVFFLEGTDWQANFNGANGSGGNTQARGTKVSDNSWHNLNLVVRQGGGTARNITVYTDGVKNATTNVGARDLNTTSPFAVGWRDGSNGGDIQMTITDIRIYNRALTDAEIANNYCRTDADLTDASLVGFWPSTTVEYDDSGNPFLRDYTTGANHLYFTNPSIISFSEVTPNACPLVDDVAYRTVPGGVDVATQVYLWMGHTINSDWSLDGQSWVPKYVDLAE
ncbi:MAG TPA: LamG-like jellyroll fold domain-containing protein [Niabella sp.]|nr:LamG-like jellyroll fold domain-containing protein [Niabella sp.]